MDSFESKEIILKGIGASPGICFGKAYLVDKEGVDVVEKYYIGDFYIQDEIRRFKTAVKNAKNELIAVIEDIPKEYRQHVNILETHMVLMKDKMLYEKIIEAIEKERINAEWALKKVVSNIKSVFQNMADSYIRDRIEDVVNVSDRIMRNLVGAHEKKIDIGDKRVVLIARDLSPAQTSQIKLERVMGFVTALGGQTSHTSIIARSLEIPAVLGLGTSMNIIKNDDSVIVDGVSGVVILFPTPKTIAEFEKQKNNYESRIAKITRSSYTIPAETIDGYQLDVLGNIELSEEAYSVLKYGGDGIGLYRTEFQYLSRNDFPKEDELFDNYKEVVQILFPKIVTIRTLDINGDKAFASSSAANESNPALGLRAIRYCLKKPEVFLIQLRAILRAAAFGNVRILIPMISTYDEIIETKMLLKQAADSLDKEGIAFNHNIEFGVMIEVPSAVIMADIMTKGVDFFSLGTNDLIQYSLAIDRGNKEVAHLNQALHPAIIRMIKYVSDVAKDNGVKIYMCGEMASDPIHVPILLGLGMQELSMNPQSIPVIKSVIRSLNVEDTRLFVKDVLKKHTASDIMSLLKDTYGHTISEVLSVFAES